MGTSFGAVRARAGNSLFGARCPVRQLADPSDASRWLARRSRARQADSRICRARRLAGDRRIVTVRSWLVGGLLLASLLASGAASAEPIRILLSASHARGAFGQTPLLHSAEDADHVQEVLTSLGG